ncbi:MAG TPA: GrpB family protein [Gemmatimonadaceae bacterium]
MRGMDDEVLGLAHRRVRLAEPTPRWAELYAEEAERLRAALGRWAPVIEHCGSTSVPGVPAKPILDILVGVPAPIDLRGVADALAPLGYAHAPDAGVPGHEVFGRGDPRTHLLHVVPLHGPAWDRMLRFRDALRADPALAAEYATLKRALAREFPEDRPAYTDRKAGFIARVLGEPSAPHA